MRTRTSVLMIAILLVLGISVAAFARPRGDPPRDDVPTLGTTTEQSTPPAWIREHQPVHHPEMLNDQARDRMRDHTATCIPDRERVGDDTATCTPDRDRDRDRAQDEDRERTPLKQGWGVHGQKGAPHRHHSTN